ncbi:hypothetical protein [Pseudomonas sp. CNPSo 3701]|uniref:hypothetical protein n=1 Tax=Pseudomonas sp. CNPSo 3701 TaxID=3027943 RepID=UPI0023640023|nr:hypothetical protein [Pseudomonas sp. CNPSo 3701]MDD1506861.1 hypothetical protein [Pseudomonas sp. CNPSo 3701]
MNVLSTGVNRCVDGACRTLDFFYKIIWFAANNPFAILGHIAYAVPHGLCVVPASACRFSGGEPAYLCIVATP